MIWLIEWQGIYNKEDEFAGFMLVIADTRNAAETLAITALHKQKNFGLSSIKSSLVSGIRPNKIVVGREWYVGR